MNYYKCADCWRVYSEKVANSGYFEGCKCQCKRFKQKRETKKIKFIAWVSSWL